MIVSSFQYANDVKQINMHESTLNRTEKKLVPFSEPGMEFNRVE